mgnify:CR=1 FL=1
MTIDGQEVVTTALGESMTGVPATVDMHFRNGAVAISYLYSRREGWPADAGIGKTLVSSGMIDRVAAARYGLSVEDIQTVLASAVARAEASEWGLTNATFEVRDVAELDQQATYDVVTAFDAIHDQAFPDRVLAGIAAALRPGGIFLMVDIKANSGVENNLTLPWASYLYTISLMHCMTVSLAAGGAGLGTVWGRQTAVRMLEEAGLVDVDVKEIRTDPFNYFYVSRAPERASS